MITLRPPSPLSPLPRAGRRLEPVTSVVPRPWPQPAPQLAEAAAAIYRGKRERPLPVLVREPPTRPDPRQPPRPPRTRPGLVNTINHQGPTGHRRPARRTASRRARSFVRVINQIGDDRTGRGSGDLWSGPGCGGWRCLAFQVGVPGLRVAVAVAGSQVIVVLRMAELVDGADDAQQAEPVCVVEEAYEVAGQPVSLLQAPGRFNVPRPGVVLAHHVCEHAPV